MHDQLGLFYISASLKKAGHDVRYFFDNRNLISELKKFSPQLAGFSALTGNHLWAQGCASEIKEFLPGVRTILGGAHATYYPEIINHPGFDFVCRGEGERAIVDLCNAIERGNDFCNIRGIWIKVGDKIYKNDFANLEENLDSIPFPDRDIYKLYPFYSLYRFYPFLLSSRGCPYNCTFCFEPVHRELTKGKGKYIRFRSPENVVQETVEIKKAHRVKSFEFVDDIFGMDRNWLRRFSSLWKEEVGAPFHCNLRTDQVDEDIVELLHYAGCISVAFGIESGSERVRNEVYRKKVKDESIVDAAKYLKKSEIKIITYNILGAPSESYEETWMTVYINQRIRADYASVSLIQPYPGLRLYNPTDRNKELDVNKFPLSFHDLSPLSSPYNNRLINLQKLFNIAVWLPALTPLVKLLVRLPVNPVYYILFLFIHAYGLWFRIKKVPFLFLINLVFNVGRVFRKNKLLVKQIPT
jgi:radical SAM superfamily enzyme YgiQ (UPF0313 family)